MKLKWLSVLHRIKTDDDITTINTTCMNKATKIKIEKNSSKMKTMLHLIKLRNKIHLRQNK